MGRALVTFIASSVFFLSTLSFAKSTKVLVVLSSESKVEVLTDRQTSKTVNHPTGFFLSELMVPIKALIDNGYEPVYANPKGSQAVMDKVSDSAFWFHNDQAAYKSYRDLCEQEGLCGSGVVGAKHLLSLNAVIKGGLDSYAAVLFPGGHAPMEDLWKDKQVGIILQHFHKQQKPTALICHAPIALLSTMKDPSAFGNALQMKDTAAIQRLSKSWIYSGYTMTVFSTKEEQQEEPGQDNVLGGYMKMYPDEALDLAGGKVLVRAQKWQSNIVRDRELLTGQNPFSDKAFAKTLIEMLEK